MKYLIFIIPLILFCQFESRVIKKFDNNYCVQYSFHSGFYGTWEDYTYAFIDSGAPRLCEKEHWLVTHDLEKAILLARSLSKNSIKTHLDSQEIIWRDNKKYLTDTNNYKDTEIIFKQNK